MVTQENILEVLQARVESAEEKAQGSYPVQLDVSVLTAREGRLLLNVLEGNA